jgi:hypothetical protein
VAELQSAAASAMPTMAQLQSAAASAMPTVAQLQSAAASAMPTVAQLQSTTAVPTVAQLQSTTTAAVPAVAKLQSTTTTAATAVLSIPTVHAAAASAASAPCHLLVQHPIRGHAHEHRVEVWRDHLAVTAMEQYPKSEHDLCRYGDSGLQGLLERNMTRPLKGRVIFYIVSPIFAH